VYARQGVNAATVADRLRRGQVQQVPDALDAGVYGAKKKLTNANLIFT
jgi:hypothetical protein